MISIVKNEQYAILNFDELSGDEQHTDLEKNIAGLYREGYSNFIFNLASLASITELSFNSFKRIDELCQKEGGLLVIVTKKNEVIDVLDGNKNIELVIMPTVEEAVDAIYMNELENDFREEEDNSPEFGETTSEDY